MVRRLKLSGRQHKNHKRQELHKTHQPKIKWITRDGTHLPPDSDALHLDCERCQETSTEMISARCKRQRPLI